MSRVKKRRTRAPSMRVVLCYETPATEGEKYFAEVKLDFIPRIGETIEIQDGYRVTWGEAGEYENIAPLECLVDQVVYRVDVRDQDQVEPGDPPIITKSTSVWIGTSGSKRMEP